jgi:uncharacterized OsmC-like protein
MSDERDRQATFGQVARGVLRSFFGIRKRAEHGADRVRLSPVQMMVAGLVGAVILVLALIIITALVTPRGG